MWSWSDCNCTCLPHLLHWLLLQQSARYVALVVTATVCQICCTGCYCNSLPDMLHWLLLHQSATYVALAVTAPVCQICSSPEQFCSSLVKLCSNMEKLCSSLEKLCFSVEQLCCSLEQFCSSLEKLCSRSDLDRFVGKCNKIFSWIFYSIDLADHDHLVCKCSKVFFIWIVCSIDLALKYLLWSWSDCNCTSLPHKLHWLLLHQSATYVTLAVTAPVCQICSSPEQFCFSLVKLCSNMEKLCSSVEKLLFTI